MKYVLRKSIEPEKAPYVPNSEQSLQWLPVKQGERGRVDSRSEAIKLAIALGLMAGITAAVLASTRYRGTYNSYPTSTSGLIAQQYFSKK